MPPGFVPDGPVPTPRSSNVLAAVGLVADPAPPGFVPDGPVPIPRSFKVFAPVGFVADLAPPGFAAATATADRPRTRLATTYRDNSQRCLSTIARRLCFPSSDRASENADEVNASRTLLHRAVRQTNGCRPRTRHDGDEGKAAKRGGWRLCCLSRRSIQDHQNQIRDQHNGHYPCHREH